MKPRSMAVMKQVEDAAAEVHQHVQRAVRLAEEGDYPRALKRAGQARGAARRFEELLQALSAAAEDHGLTGTVPYPWNHGNA